MVDHAEPQPADRDYAPILTTLERQLSELDRMGSMIAAAHLDAAIQQVRLDQARFLSVVGASPGD